MNNFPPTRALPATFRGIEAPLAPREAAAEAPAGNVSPQPGAALGGLQTLPRTGDAGLNGATGLSLRTMAEDAVRQSVVEDCVHANCGIARELCPPGAERQLAASIAQHLRHLRMEMPGAAD